MTGGDEMREDEQALERAVDRRRATVLVDAALCAVLVAAIGLFFDWRSQTQDIGVTVRSGYAAAPVLVFVTGALTLVLLGLARWHPDLPGWSGAATAVSAVAALGCIGGVAGDGDVAGGPAAWIGLFAFAAAALLALFACLAGTQLETSGRSADARIER